MKWILIVWIFAVLASFVSAASVEEITGLGYQLKSSGEGVDLTKPVILSFTSKGELGVVDGQLNVKDGRLIVEKKIVVGDTAGRSSKSVQATFSVTKNGFSFLARGDVLTFSKDDRYVRVRVKNGVIESGFDTGEKYLIQCYNEECILELYVAEVEKSKPFVNVKGMGYILEKGYKIKDSELKKVIIDGFYSEHATPLRDLTALRLGGREKDKGLILEVYASFAEKTSMLNHASMTTLNAKGVPIPVRYREGEGFEGKYFQVSKFKGDTSFALLSSGWKDGSLAVKDGDGNDVLWLHEGKALVSLSCAGKSQGCLAVNSVRKEAQVVLAGSRNLVKMSNKLGYKLNVISTDSSGGMILVGDAKGSLQLSHHSVKLSPKVLPWYSVKTTFAIPMKGMTLLCDYLTKECFLNGKSVYRFVKKPDLAPKFETGKICPFDEAPKPACDPGISDKCLSKGGELFIFNPKTKCWISWVV